MTKKHLTGDLIIKGLQERCGEEAYYDYLESLTIKELQGAIAYSGYNCQKNMRKDDYIGFVLDCYYSEIGQELKKCETVSEIIALVNEYNLDAGTFELFLSFEAMKIVDKRDGLNAMIKAYANTRGIITMTEQAVKDFDAANCDNDRQAILNCLSDEQLREFAKIKKIDKYLDEVITKTGQAVNGETVVMAYRYGLLCELHDCKSEKDVIKFAKDRNLSALDFHRAADSSMNGNISLSLESLATIEASIKEYVKIKELETESASENYNEAAIKRLDQLFDELVPAQGPAESLAGELVRAVSRIGGRYNNDGDKLGVGFGRETCNPAGRFLRKYGDEKIADAIKGLWTAMYDETYKFYLSKLIKSTVEYVDEHPEFKNIKSESFYDCKDPEQDVCDDDEYDYECFNYEYEYTPEPLEKLLANAPINSFGDALRLTQDAETLEEVEKIFRRCTYEALCECPYGKNYTKDELIDRCTRIYVRITRIVSKKADNIIKQRPRLVA